MPEEDGVYKWRTVRYSKAVRRLASGEGLVALTCHVSRVFIL